MTASTIELVLADAARSGFELDPSQLRVLNRLAELAAAASADPPATGHGEFTDRPRGIYVWGPVGRGKTWLLDAVTRTLPPDRVRRVHSHRFFDELHRRLHAHRSHPVPVLDAEEPPQVPSRPHRPLEREVFEQAVDDVVGTAGLLVFDELQINDPGDAALMTRLLELLDERGIALVVSSNSAPEDLLPDPVWHRIIEPGVALIVAGMDVVELAGPTDFRTVETPRAIGGGSGFAAGAWLHPEALTAHGLRPPSPEERTRLALGGREFSVDAARESEGELWVSFAELCDRPLSTMEYLDWAGRFGERWVITGLPSFSRSPRSAQRRFLMAIDVLCDSEIPTVLVSSIDRQQYLTEVLARPSAARLASRLSLLRSA
ncbi:cell division protein ZapE [Herbiconiux sp. P15]|uniref:cell division protein ZapE n=1 Tax=Herbiconiux liukaitaii TaxID=3342799 RepID=UPI0035B8E11D